MISVGEHSACWGLPYKEGVGGSSPATPTEIRRWPDGFSSERRRGVGRTPSFRPMPLTRPLLRSPYLGSGRCPAPSHHHDERSGCSPPEAAPRSGRQRQWPSRDPVAPTATFGWRCSDFVLAERASPATTSRGGGSGLGWASLAAQTQGPALADISGRIRAASDSGSGVP